MYRTPPLFCGLNNSESGDRQAMSPGTQEHLKIVFLDRETLPATATLRPLSFPHELVSYDQSLPEQVGERCVDADIIISNKVRISGDVIRSLANLKFIAVCATGTDNVDLDACRERGIGVSNVRGYAVSSVPEHTLALMLALCRSIGAYHSAVAAGRWDQSDQFCFLDYPIVELKGRILGIIGSGSLGQAVARLAEAFGMTVRFAGRKGDASTSSDRTPFEQIIAESDFVSLHCPLTAETQNLIGKAELEAMKPNAYLINVSRGGLVDEDALVRAIEAGQIGGGAFDVATKEPMPKSNPLMKIMDRPNFILTPHVAWVSDEASQGLADQTIDNIEAFVAGAPRNVIV